jgi:dienelactone hydrolase
MQACRGSLWAAVVLGISTSAFAETPPRFHFAESLGPYKVGLKVVEQYDFSRAFRGAVDLLGRPYTGQRARPLQTLVWYPAEANTGKPMTVADYAALAATETSFDKPETQKVKDLSSGLTPTLRDSLWAVRDAPPKAGKYPLVVYAPSFNSVSWENADLCELLASHGYVVVASPSMGASNRLMTGDLAGADAQARDISFLIGYAQSLPNADLSQVAVAGYSWGGMSNLFAAARDNRIGALVALDGTLRYEPGLVQKAGDVHPEQMTIPLLFFAAREMSLEEKARETNPENEANLRGPNVLNAWTHGDLLTVHMLGLVHRELGSMLQRNEDVWKGFAADQRSDEGREEGIDGYAWLSRYTIQFLDAYLKHDAAAAAWLEKTPAQNGVPKHVITTEYRHAKGLPASLEALRAECHRRGFEHAKEVYAAMTQDNPGFKLDESALDGWGWDLIYASHFPEAISLLKLNASLHPESGQAYNDLGSAYRRSGQKQLAIENYRKSLEKDPSNDNARNWLKELGAAVPATKP